MDIHITVEKIRELTYRMIKESEREKNGICFTIKDLIRDIEKENTEPGWGYVDEKISQLIWHVESMAHLVNGNGHPDDRHHVWALGALNTIERNISKAGENKWRGIGSDTVSC